jgi:hypothetical protein
MDIKQRLAHDLDRHTLTVLSGDELRELRRDALAEIERLEKQVHVTGNESMDIKKRLREVVEFRGPIDYGQPETLNLCREALVEIERQAEVIRTLGVELELARAGAWPNGPIAMRLEALEQWQLVVIQASDSLIRKIAPR